MQDQHPQIAMFEEAREAAAAAEAMVWSVLMVRRAGKAPLAGLMAVSLSKSSQCHYLLVCFDHY